jgi:hypothetical protein
MMLSLSYRLVSRAGRLDTSVENCRFWAGLLGAYDTSFSLRSTRGMDEAQM